MELSVKLIDCETSEAIQAELDRRIAEKTAEITANAVARFGPTPTAAQWVSVLLPLVVGLHVKDEGEQELAAEIAS